MGSISHAIRCELGMRGQIPVLARRESAQAITKSGELAEKGGKIVLQPRICTLRSFAEDNKGLLDSTKIETSPFFETFADYVDSSKKSRDFEIISGRLAMMVFAGTVLAELVTGNSVFGKMDLQGIAETGGVCLGAAMLAAAFAWFSSGRHRVDRIFTLSCNSFIDSLVDEIVDGLFYDGELTDWSDEL